MLTSPLKVSNRNIYIYIMNIYEVKNVGLLDFSNKSRKYFQKKHYEYDISSFQSTLHLIQ